MRALLALWVALPGIASAQTRSALVIESSTFAFEDLLVGDEDHNDLVFDFNVRCVVDDVTEDLVSEEIRLVPRAAGAARTNGLGLRLPNVPQSVTLSDDGGATSLCEGDCTQWVDLIPDFDDGFAPRGTGFVNTEGSADHAGKSYVVTMTYAPGTPAATSGGFLTCAVPDFALARPDLIEPIDAGTTAPGNGQPLAGRFPYRCPPPDTECLFEDRIPWAPPREHVGIAEPGAYGERFLSWLTDLTDATPCAPGECVDEDWYLYPGVDTIDVATLAATTPLDPAPHCDDEAQNGGETGIDCGGDVCAPCLPLRVNVDWTGAVVGGGLQPSLSADGRYVAFSSAYNRPGLVPSHFNIWGDVYVRDTVDGVTTLVSVDQTGGAADWGGAFASISADGRYVAWESKASDLVPGDTNDKTDIFVRDLVLGTTERVSVSTEGAQGDGDSWRPTISGDGRYVAFVTQATNLFGTDANGGGNHDVVRHDRVTGETVLVSANDAGEQGNANAIRFQPSISPDGRYVAFSSGATNLVVGDTNNAADVFRRDMDTGTTIRVSLADDEGQANGQCVDAVMSADGTVFAFRSNSALVPGSSGHQIFVRDVAAGTTTLASVSSAGVAAIGDSLNPSISADGRFVAFQSKASNLVSPAPTMFQDNIYLRDRVGGTTRRISVPWDGVESTQSSALSQYPAFSSDGTALGFSGANPTLVPGDTYVGDGNFDNDVFLVRLPGAPAP